jgi:hypothetical protein
MSGISRRGLVEECPEDTKILNSLEEFREFNRLDDKCVHTQFVAANQVLFLARGRQHHDGDMPQHIIALDPLQNLKPVDFREFQVKKDYSRIAAGSLTMGAGRQKIIKSLRAIASDDDFVRKLALFKCSKREFEISGTILDQKDWTKFRQAYEPFYPDLAKRT